MSYGISIEEGARDWQIFQQNANGTVDITVSGSYRRGELSRSVPIEFFDVETGAPNIKARIAYEDSGASVVAWQQCEVLSETEWRTTFTAVPAGGLYRIESYFDFEGWTGLSVTRGDVVRGIGVGDVYLIGGQSNAAGRSKQPIVDGPEIGVHQLRNDGQWSLATHPLNETTNARHTGHFENHNPGHSPYLHFAKQLRAKLGYPIGLVMAAYGGSPLSWWNPDENGALFVNMTEMMAAAGTAPKAVLWYQGEADGFNEGGETYLERFTRFVEHTRTAFGNPDLPFFTVQLNRCIGVATREVDRQWGLVREAQRQAPHRISNVYVVPANDLALYDFIHVGSAGNLVIGERTADAVLSELHGRNTDWRAPEPTSVVRVDGRTVELTLSPVRNWINTFDLEPAQCPIEAEDAGGIQSPSAYTIEDNRIRLSFERELANDAVLHGVWRMNGAPVVPADCMRLPMLSFYGVPITKDEK